MNPYRPTGLLRMFGILGGLALWSSCGGSASPGSDAAVADATPQADAMAEPDDEVPWISDTLIFDPSKLHHFELELAPADWDSLLADPLREQYVPATLIFEGRRYDYAAVRFKGAYNSLESCVEDGQIVCPKLSFKVSFNEYIDGRFAGLRKLVLNSAVRDPTMMHDLLGYWVFREMGLPAPRASHAELTVNGEYQGLFVLIEQVDKEFIQRHWAQADDGNLYKSVWPQYDDPEAYLDALKTNEHPPPTPDVSGMMDFKSKLDSATVDSFAVDMGGMLDLGQLARFMAVDQAVNAIDGSRIFYCYEPGWEECSNNNYYWYEEPTPAGRRFHLIPWDLDEVFWDINRDLGRSMWSTDCTRTPACIFWGDPDCDPATEDIGIMPAQCDPLYKYVHRATWMAYLEALREVAEGPLARIGAYAESQRNKIRAAVRRDPHGPGLASWESENEWLDEVLVEQQDEIIRLLAEEGMAMSRSAVPR